MLPPEVHIECEVHELLTDLRHGEDVQRHAHGHRLAPVVRTHAAIIANLMWSQICHECVTCHVSRGQYLETFQQRTDIHGLLMADVPEDCGAAEKREVHGEEVHQV